jgi:hypothetical protein
MVRCTALLLVVLVGCSQSPAPKEPGPRSRTSARASLKGGADRNTTDRAKAEAPAEPAKKKVEPTGPPTGQEVRSVAKDYLGRVGSGVKDVEVTFVSAPIDLPEKKKEELESSARDARAYYVGFTGNNLALGEKVESKNYVLLVGRAPEGVKVLGCCDSVRAIEGQLGQDWLRKNAPPQK